ncbi:MAG: hypothetical protein ABIH51_00630 [Patescibacteria group bacterium]
MNIFKKFNIWWGWWLKKQKVLGTLIFAITMLFSVVGGAVFVSTFFPIFKEEAIHIVIRLRTITGILTPIFFYLYINCFVSCMSNNYRMAIDQAREVLAGKLQYLSQLDVLIQKARETKDPKKINEWIMNWKALSLQKEKMQKLKKKKEDIEKGILLKEINAEIETEKKIIIELEAKLI